MAKIPLNRGKSAIMELRLSDLRYVTPFQNQRDIDKSRVKEIDKYYTRCLLKGELIHFETVMAFVKDHKNKDTLMGNDNKRTNMCIVDGQHRLYALRQLSKRNPKINNMCIPVIIHYVETMKEANTIQNNLFKQKPVSKYDKLKNKSKNKPYNLQGVFYVVTCMMKRAYNLYGNLVREITGNQRWYRIHFNLTKFDSELRNSDNIEIWTKREITSKEIFSGIEALVDYRYKKSLSIEDDDIFKKIFPKIEKNKKNQSEEHYKFNLFTSFYYKNYQRLIKDLEDKLNITDEESDYESIADSDSEESL